MHCEWITSETFEQLPQDSMHSSFAAVPHILQTPMSASKVSYSRQDPTASWTRLSQHASPPLAHF